MRGMGRRIVVHAGRDHIACAIGCADWRACPEGGRCATVSTTSRPTNRTHRGEEQRHARPGPARCGRAAVVAGEAWSRDPDPRSARSFADGLPVPPPGREDRPGRGHPARRGGRSSVGSAHEFRWRGADLPARTAGAAIEAPRAGGIPADRQGPLGRVGTPRASTRPRDHRGHPLADGRPMPPSGREFRQGGDGHRGWQTDRRLSRREVGARSGLGATLNRAPLSSQDGTRTGRPGRGCGPCPDSSTCNGSE